MLDPEEKIQRMLDRANVKITSHLHAMEEQHMAMARELGRIEEVQKKLGAALIHLTGICQNQGAVIAAMIEIIRADHPKEFITVEKALQKAKDDIISSDRG